MTSEDYLQIEVINYLRYQHPKRLFFHTPNGGKRGVSEAAKFKRMGVLAGVPDIIIAEQNKLFIGLCLELKIGKNKTTDSQNEVIEKFKKNGWQVEVCYTFDKAKEIIDNYFN